MPRVQAALPLFFHLFPGGDVGENLRDILEQTAGFACHHGKIDVALLRRVHLRAIPAVIAHLDSIVA